MPTVPPTPCPTPYICGLHGPPHLGTVLESGNKILTDGHLYWEDISLILFIRPDGTKLLYHTNTEVSAHEKSERGTTLLTLPQPLDSGFRVTPATRGDPNALNEGAVVAVVYDIAAGDQPPALQVLWTTVIKKTTEDPLAGRIADPQNFLDGGDSGGGVYNKDGQLVANTWSIKPGEPTAEIAWFPGWVP